jgi:two-component system, NarL family, response regulator DegU
MKKINLLIAEDHQLFRQTIVDVLEQTQRFIIREVTNGEELIRAIETEVPDVILLDLQMPVMNGNEAFTLIKHNYPKIKVIICSQYDTSILKKNFSDRGADGYISKFDYKDLQCIVDEVKRAIGKNKKQEAEEAVKSKFTKREMEIIPLLCEGKTTNEISAILNISVKAVEKHRNNLHKKTGAKNFAHLIKYLAKEGLDFLGK